MERLDRQSNRLSTGRGLAEGISTFGFESLALLMEGMVNHTGKPREFEMSQRKDGSTLMRIAAADRALLEQVRERIQKRIDTPRRSDRRFQAVESKLFSKDHIGLSDAVRVACRSYLRSHSKRKH